MKKKQAIAFLLSAAMTTGVTIPVLANDITGHWAQATITKWQQNGKIDGYQDGTFQPDKSITRAEFLRLLNHTVDTSLPSSENAQFSDVQQKDWFYQDVMQAMHNKITTGFADGTFRPNEPITRAQAAMMISSAKGLSADETAANHFQDSVPTWAKGAVGAVVAAEYLAGYTDGTFGADKNMTMAEAVSALDRMEQPQNNQTAAQTEELPDVITDNIVIFNQEDADKLQGKRVTGKTLLYFSEDLTLPDAEFVGEVIVIPMETEDTTNVASAYIGKDVTVTNSYAQRDTKKVNLKNTKSIENLVVIDRKLIVIGVVDNPIKKLILSSSINSKPPTPIVTLKVPTNSSKIIEENISTGNGAGGTESDIKVDPGEPINNIIGDPEEILNEESNSNVSQETLAKMQDILDKLNNSENATTSTENVTTPMDVTVNADGIDFKAVSSGTQLPVNSGTASVTFEGNEAVVTFTGDDDNVVATTTGDGNINFGSDGRDRLDLSGISFNPDTGAYSFGFTQSESGITMQNNDNKGQSQASSGQSAPNETNLAQSQPATLTLENLNVDELVIQQDANTQGHTSMLQAAVNRQNSTLQGTNQNQNQNTNQNQNQNTNQNQNQNTNNSNGIQRPTVPDSVYDKMRESILNMNNTSVKKTTIESVDQLVTTNMGNGSQIEELLNRNNRQTNLTIDKTSQLGTFVHDSNTGKAALSGDGTLDKLEASAPSLVDTSNFKNPINVEPLGGKKSSSRKIKHTQSAPPATPPDDIPVTPPTPPVTPPTPPVTQTTEIKTVTLAGLDNLKVSEAKDAKLTTTDETYTIGNITWKQGNNEVTNWATAEAGTYQASVTLTAKANHKFVAPVVKLNGKDVIDTGVAADGSTLTLTIPVNLAADTSVTPPPAETTKITTVALTGLQNLKVSEAKDAKLTTTDETYTIGDITWKQNNQEVDWTTATAGEYQASVTLTAKANHKFVAPTVTLNGTANTTYTLAENDTTLTLTIPVELAADTSVTPPEPAKPTEIKTVALTGLQNLKVNEAENAKLTTTDETYTISKITWKQNNQEVTDWTTAKAGEYQASVTLTAKDNHKFVAPTVTLNGTALTNKDLAADGSTLTLTIPVNLTTQDPAIESLTLTVPEENQGTLQNSVVIKDKAAIQDIKVTAKVNNAAEGSKVRFYFPETGSWTLATFSSNLYTQVDEIEVPINDQGFAETTLTIKGDQSHDLKINAQYKDSNGVNSSVEEKEINVIVMRTPIDCILINKMLAIPYEGDTIPKNPEIGVIENKGYRVESAEIGKYINNGFESLKETDTTFVKESSSSYYVLKVILRATTEADLSEVTTKEQIEVSGENNSNGIQGGNAVSIAPNGEELEILFTFQPKDK